MTLGINIAATSHGGTQQGCSNSHHGQVMMTFMMVCECVSEGLTCPSSCHPCWDLSTILNSLEGASGRGLAQTRDPLEVGAQRGTGACLDVCASASAVLHRSYFLVAVCNQNLYSRRYDVKQLQKCVPSNAAVNACIIRYSLNVAQQHGEGGEMQ